MKFRTGYDGDGDKASLKSGLVCVRPTLTKQSFKDECDINVIVKRFGIGYDIPSSFRLPQFGDFTGLDSFEDAANAIAVANEQFDMLPAAIRSRFSNDPAAFVDFVTNADNLDDVIAMGLAPERPSKPSDAVDTPATPLQAAKGSPEPSGDA